MDIAILGMGKGHIVRPHWYMYALTEEPTGYHKFFFFLLVLSLTNSSFLLTFYKTFFSALNSIINSTTA